MTPTAARPFIRRSSTGLPAWPSCLNAGADPTLGCKAIGMANNVLHQAVLRTSDDQMAKTISVCASASALTPKGAPHPLGDLRSPVLSPDPKTAGLRHHRDERGRANKEEGAAKALVEAGADPKFVPSAICCKSAAGARNIPRTNNSTWGGMGVGGAAEAVVGDTQCDEHETRKVVRVTRSDSG